MRLFSPSLLLGGLFVSLALISAAAEDEQVSEVSAGDKAHVELLARIEFPSAQECAVCHPQHYREWSVSAHAYAQISPTFNAYQATLVHLTNGTLGDFCERCHTQVGMTRGEPVISANAQRSEVAREGITCVVCHRVADAYGKITGRFPLEPGGLEEPVYGPRDDSELQRVIASGEYPGFSGEDVAQHRKIHREARLLEQISHPGFCGRCHDVRMVDGFRLEDAFSEYKQTPAAERGETCQDCHMGPVPGQPSRYPLAPAAIVGGKPTRPARRTNHMFVGPDDPTVHPGIFPHDSEAMELASPTEWSSFDYEAGWGTEAFEDSEPDASQFPEVWAFADDRFYAREVLERQLALRKEAHDRGTELLRNGYGLSEIRNLSNGTDELAFEVEVLNRTEGHSVPTGLIVERNVFLQVEVTDAAGAVIFRSGDLDPNGDVRDTHSLYVHAGALPLDDQLFNLRSSFLVRGVAGGEREQVLPANYSLDPLLFVRPSPTPALLLGGVPTVRLHKRNIEVGGRRKASYHVASSALTGNAPYDVRVKLVAGQLPPHLIHAISGVGFDYGMSARDISDAIVRGYRVLWERELRIGGD